MITRYRAWINGQGLHDVDPALIITDIRESEPKESIATAGNSYRDGLRVLYRRRETLSVAVRFVIREYDTVRRKAIMTRVLSWAQDGWLTISDRPEQRLWVMVESLPVVASSLKWTEELTIVLTAYAVPYWQEVYPVSASKSGDSGTVHLAPMGDMPCKLEATVSNTSGGMVDSVEISVNGGSFLFFGLGLASGQMMSIAYDENGILSAKIGESPVLSKRSSDSADDLILTPGDNAITFRADHPVNVNIKARGMWR